jgi:hypothetical protein
MSFFMFLLLHVLGSPVDSRAASRITCGQLILNLDKPTLFDVAFSTHKRISAGLRKTLTDLAPQTKMQMLIAIKKAETPAPIFVSMTKLGYRMMGEDIYAIRCTKKQALIFLNKSKEYMRWAGLGTETPPSPSVATTEQQASQTLSQ